MQYYTGLSLVTCPQCSISPSTHYALHSPLPSVLLQCGADASIRNSDGKTALDLAEPTAKLVLSGEYKKEEVLEAARSGNEELLMALITPLNVNCHDDDGRKVRVQANAICRFEEGCSG